MNKHLIVFGAASAIAASVAVAQELSVTTTFAWESSYMFRGAQFAEETFMPAVDLAIDDFYVGIWTAMPVGNEANEVDYYAGYGYSIDDVTSLDFGVTHYTFPDSGSDFGQAGSTTELYIGAAFDVPLSPSIYVYYDLDLEALTLEGSIGYSQELSETTTFDTSAALGHVSADEGTDYTYGVLSAGFGYAVNEAVSASLYANYSWSTEDLVWDGDGMKSSEFWFGFSVTGGF